MVMQKSFKMESHPTLAGGGEGLGKAFLWVAIGHWAFA